MSNNIKIACSDVSHSCKNQITEMLTLAVALLVCGCHKRPEVASNVNNHDTSPATLAKPNTSSWINQGQVIVPKNPLPPNSPQLQDPVTKANLRWLNAQVQQYVSQFHQMPNSFANLVNDLRLQTPEPPSGMHFVLCYTFVTLEPNQ